jgi:RES domain-containing protein
VPVVYTSSTLSLAALEYLVHVQIEDVPDDLVSLEIDVPDDAGMEQIEIFDLPDDWNQVPDHPACTDLGDEWAASSLGLVLRVPSAIIPHESNVLLNPLHPEMSRVKVVAVREFAFDPRLLA